MANFYSIQGQCAAFVAGRLSDLQWRNISHVERDGKQCILHMKNGDVYELSIKRREDERTDAYALLHKSVVGEDIDPKTISS